MTGPLIWVALSLLLSTQAVGVACFQRWVLGCMVLAPGLLGVPPPLTHKLAFQLK